MKKEEDKEEEEDHKKLAMVLELKYPTKLKRNPINRNHYVSTFIIKNT